MTLSVPSMADIEYLAGHTADWYLETETHPLSCQRLWDQREGRTSQLRAAQNLGPLITLVFGGNRAGKTHLAKLLAVAYALGRDHPMVVAWGALNGFPLGEIPVGPGRVAMSALTSNDSRRYHRGDIGALLPSTAKIKWNNRDGRGESFVKIWVPGYSEPAEIWFKSDDQGRAAWQGDKFRFIVDDEEHSQEMFDEQLMRILDVHDARIIMPMTPLKGMTWVYDRFYVDPDPRTTRVHWLYGTDNPHLSRERREMILSQYGSHQRAARERGEFVVLQGRVYPEWSRAVHLIPAFEIPADWPRYRAIDFGTRNPFVCLWGALSPDDVLYIYREHYRAEWTLAQHARRIRQLEGGEAIEMSWADPEDAQQLLALGVDHDMTVNPARKAVSAGIDRVAERLQAHRITGKPAMYVFDSCPNTAREFGQYVWMDRSSKHLDQPDRPRKKDDHCMDSVRYLCMGVATAGVATA